MKRRREPEHRPAHPLEGPVRNLQELFTVTMGVALVKAVERMTEGHSVAWHEVPDFVAVLATIIPFYHGAMRHLDVRYIEQEGHRVRRGVLLSDFLLLFVEACALLAAAFMIGNSRGVAWAIVTLLALDVIWALVVYRFGTVGERHFAELRWLTINAITAPLMAAVVLAWPIGSIAAVSEPQVSSIGLAIAIAGIAVLRSVADYWLSWEFYFPWPGREPSA